MIETVRNLAIDQQAYAFCSLKTLSGVQANGTSCTPGPAIRGGLAPWQVRRTEQLMSENLDRTITLEQMAAACRVSTSHFARSFKATMGQAPHRWLLEYRVERAKKLMTGSGHTLADVALLCGFSDQSHFSRTFRRFLGCTPGAWRRAQERSATCEPLVMRIDDRDADGSDRIARGAPACSQGPGAEKRHAASTIRAGLC